MKQAHPVCPKRLGRQFTANRSPASLNLRILLQVARTRLMRIQHSLKDLPGSSVFRFHWLTAVRISGREGNPAAAVMRLTRQLRPSTIGQFDPSVRDCLANPHGRFTWTYPIWRIDGACTRRSGGVVIKLDL